MSIQSLGGFEYVIKRTSDQQRDTAKYYCKPSSPGYTGGGYWLWRDSVPPSDHSVSGKRKDVYVSEHRLLAVVECYPMDMPIEEVLDDLDGRDVHHTTGMPGANFGDSPNFDMDDLPEAQHSASGIEVLDHSTHSEVTQTERRAWAEDAKEQADEQVTLDQSGDCPRCNGEMDTPATSPAFEGYRCLECATELADGENIDV